MRQEVECLLWKYYFKEDQGVGRSGMILRPIQYHFLWLSELGEHFWKVNWQQIR